MKHLAEKAQLVQGMAANVVREADVGSDPLAGPVGTKRALIETFMPGWKSFAQHIAKCLEATYATDNRLTKEPRGSALIPAPGAAIEPFDNALIRLRNIVCEAHERGNKVIFVGNGGSAAICSHMAVDWTKNGGIRSIALNDAPTLTCLSNDFGYENVFAKQLEYYAHPEDVVIIISSSGKSPNILEAARWCSDNRMRCITLSGMRPDNKLRLRGVINFYTPVMDYGLIELTHACVLHSIVSVKWQ